MCQGVRSRAVWAFEFGGDTDQSTGAEAMRLTPDTEGKIFDVTSVANNVGGQEVCDGTDQAVFEDNTACSGGTLVLGDSNRCLGTHEGMQGHADSCVCTEAPASLRLLVQEAWR